MVYVGTNDGNRGSAFAVRSSDGGTVWSFFGGALPGVVVTDVNGVTADAGATWGPLQANGNSCALTAGATPWLHGALDPALGMFYVTFGNVRSLRLVAGRAAAPGRQPVRQFARCPRLEDGRLQVAPPVGPPRHLGHGQRALAGAGRRHGRRRRRSKAIYYGSKAHMTFILDRTNGKPLTGAIEMKPVVHGHAPEQRADAAVPGAWHVGRQPRARQGPVHRLGKARHRQHPGQPVARRAQLQRLPARRQRQPGLHRAELPRCRQAVRAVPCRLQPAREAGRRTARAACGNRTSTSRS